jgi:molecular chaperone GrpE
MQERAASATSSSRCCRCSTTSRLARDHGDLVDGPFAAIADKLEAVLGKYGIERFGAKGEAFDPMHHEALMHAPWPRATTDLPTDDHDGRQVLQPGYRAGSGRAPRPLRVADPA